VRYRSIPYSIAKSVSDDYQYVVQSLRDPFSPSDETEMGLEQISLSDLLKLAIKEAEEVDIGTQNHSVDTEFRLKQHLWQYILKIKSINNSQEEKENRVNFVPNEYSESLEFNDFVNHPRKKFKNNHSHSSISISAPNIYYIEKDTYGSNLQQPFHSNDEEDIQNHYLMMNLDEYEEEIALIKVNNFISNEKRCPAPDPIAMLYGIDRYLTYSMSNDSDSNEM